MKYPSILPLLCLLWLAAIGYPAMTAQATTVTTSPSISTAGRNDPALRQRLDDLQQQNSRLTTALRVFQFLSAAMTLLTFGGWLVSQRRYRSHNAPSPDNVDIDRQQTTQAARSVDESPGPDNQDLLQGMLESATEIMLYALDREYRYLAFNTAHREGAKFLWGTDIEVGQSWLEGVHTANTEEHREFCRRGFDRVLAGESFSIESVEKVVLESGEVLTQYFDNFGSPMRNDQGEVIGLTVFCVNISARKAAERKLKENLEFTEGIINAIPDLLFEVDTEGRYLNAWAHDPSLLAAQKEALIGKTVHQVLSQENAETAMAAIREAEEHGLAHGMRLCIDLPQGRRWFEHSLGKNVRDASSSPTFLVLSRDITARVENERKLEEALKFSDSIINAIPDLLFEVDGDGRYLNIWTHTPELLAAHRDVLLHKTVTEALDAESATTIMEALDEANRQELSFGKTIQIDLPQGERWFELSVSKMAGIHTEAPHFLVLSRDITRLKQSELALREHRDELEARVTERTAELHESNLQLRAEITERHRAQVEMAAREREFRTLAEHLPDNLARYDRHARITYANPTLEKTLDFRTSQVRGMTPIETHRGLDFSDYQRHLEHTLATGLPSEFELILPDAGYGVRTHHILIVAEHEANGAVGGALAIGRDVTALKQTERKLMLLNRALDEAFDAVYLLDSDHHIRYVNKAAVRTLGYTYEELLSLTLFDIDPIVTPQHAHKLVREVTHGGHLNATVESQHRRKNGERFPVEIGGATIRYEGETLILTTVRDISERKKAERLLHEQQEALRAALDNAPDAIVRYDRELRRTYFNTAMQRALTRSNHSPSGKTTDENSPIIEHERYRELLHQVLDSGRERQAELPFSARDEIRWVDLRFAPEFDAKGRVASVLVFGRDVTTRRAMERENALLRAMADNAVDPLIFAHSMDVEAGLPLVYFNPSFTQHLGYSDDEMRGLIISEVTTWSKAELAEHMTELRHKTAMRFETEQRRKNGERVPVEVTLSYLMHNGEELAAGYCMDITQRKEAERRLRESHAQLQAFARRLETAREQERKHIARELHDDLAQYLTALQLQVSALGIKLERIDSTLAEKVAQSLELIDTTKQAVRNLSQRLRPAVLDMGVGPALDWLVSDFTNQTGVPCQLTTDGSETAMADHCASVLFRVVQESLTNITRHAGACAVSVRLTGLGDHYRLAVNDDGKGFEPNERRSGSLGLLGMHERLLAVGGSLEIDTAPGMGTTITAHIPVHSGKENE